LRSAHRITELISTRGAVHTNVPIACIGPNVKATSTTNKATAAISRHTKAGFIGPPSGAAILTPRGLSLASDPAELQQIPPLRYFDLLKNLIAAMTAMSRIKNSRKFDGLMSM
jgi:hypothetical protein